MREIRTHLQQLEEEIGIQEADPAALIAPGDLVQIRPYADRTFGGMFMHVCRVRPAHIEGYLLRPHRGGCREAWHTFSPPELLRLGRSFFEQPKFARRPW
jgi:hypothetical protein